MKFKRNALFIAIAATVIGLPSFALDDNASANAPAGSKFAAKVPGSGGACKAGGRSCGMKKHGMRRGPHFSFSDEQLEKFSTIKSQYLNETGPARLELKSLKRQQKDLMTKADSDRGQILAMQDKINSLRDKLATSSLKYKLDKFAVLTADQQKLVRHRILVGQAFGGGFHHRFHKRSA